MKVFEKKFYTRFGPGEVTFPMKVEDWARKRDDWVGKIVLTFVVPWLQELWIEVKTRETMYHVDEQAKALVTLWDTDDDYMMDPTYTEKKDPTNPFGVSEMRSTHDFMDDSQTET